MNKIRLNWNRATDPVQGWGIVSFFQNQLLRNWTLLNKTMLILSLSIFINLFMLAWDLFVLYHPQFYPWVNLAVIHTHLSLGMIFMSVFIGLLLLCHFCSQQRWVEKFMPMLSVQLFTLVLLIHGYFVGSFSPATMVGYVGWACVGLILFDRKIIYCALAPATIVLLLLNYLSTFAGLPYAPLFNMEPMNQTVMHPFWVMSMFFFLVPLMLVCLFLFEILLSQWRIREATIATLSRIDPLTNVMNRRSIANQLEQLHQQRKALYSVVLLDLDHFKHINDNYGHDMGDQVLIQVAECLAQHVREQDMIGRFGGEEFILLLPNTTTEQAQHVAERCRIALTELNFVYEQQPFSISASFGISSSQNASEPQQIIRQADQALYAVKTAGRNQVQIYCK
ncbi:MAG: GGDEF domain-containing protein [Acinetobacter sp.]|nr:GGDEF domain-containing protein [Acinetobacter sp.]